MNHDDIKSNVLTTTLESAINWGRKNSLWPMPFGTACCGIEFMAVLAARTDIARFGAEAIRFSPRQSDLLIVAGSGLPCRGLVTLKDELRAAPDYRRGA